MMNHSFDEMTIDELLVEVCKEVDRWGTLEYGDKLANALVSKALSMNLVIMHKPDNTAILSCKDNMVSASYFRRYDEGMVKVAAVNKIINNAKMSPEAWDNAPTDEMEAYRMIVDMLENYASNKDAYELVYDDKKDKIDQFDGEYRFLSNFYNKKPFNYNGMMFWSSEAAFQAQKCVNDEDKVKIANCKNPSMAKKIGRGVQMREDWNDVRGEEMYKILKAKFSDPELKRLLLDTGKAQLVEGNHWHDNYWGACTCDGCKAKFHNNKLGKTLMKVREELK